MKPELELLRRIEQLEKTVALQRSEIEQLKRTDAGKLLVELNQIKNDIKILKEGGNL